MLRATAECLGACRAHCDALHLHSVIGRAFGTCRSPEAVHEIKRAARSACLSEQPLLGTKHVEDLAVQGGWPSPHPEAAMTRAPPRVSVVMPAFNSQGTLEAAISSLQKQFFEDW